MKKVKNNKKRQEKRQESRTAILADYVWHRLHDIDVRAAKKLKRQQKKQK